MWIRLHSLKPITCYVIRFLGRSNYETTDENVFISTLYNSLSMQGSTKYGESIVANALHRGCCRHIWYRLNRRREITCPEKHRPQYNISLEERQSCFLVTNYSIFDSVSNIDYKPTPDGFKKYNKKWWGFNDEFLDNHCRETVYWPRNTTRTAQWFQKISMSLLLCQIETGDPWEP